jgi:endonuclease/exonuclease/phosphatase family metal-dependent hydrolase
LNKTINPQSIENGNPDRNSPNHQPHTTTPLPNPTYTYQNLKALTLNTRGMHTTILDIQQLLTTHPEPHILAMTETKHRHIKSIWRQTLKNYKLIYNPSLHNKLTKRCSGGAILAIHKNAYTSIKPIPVPKQYQPYLAIAHLTPTTGSAIMAIAAYLPQHHNTTDSQTYLDTLQWLQTLLTSEHKHTPVLLGGDLQATLSPQHHSFYKPLADFITDTQLQHLGDPLTPTYTPTNTPMDHWLLRLPTGAHHTSPTTTTAIPTEFSDHYALLADIPQIGDLVTLLIQIHTPPLETIPSFSSPYLNPS